MSRIAREEYKCSVCGTVSEQEILVSTNTFCGAPDLDLRPAEMKRSTMAWWIQECPKCGYISEELHDETNVDETWLQNKYYLKCNGFRSKSKIAVGFYKYYLINLYDNNPHDAFKAVLHAAWACDDVREFENATHCRQLALAEIPKILSIDSDYEDILVMKADLLRRSGEFDRVVEEYKNVHFSNSFFKRIIEFQIEKAIQHDAECYTLEVVSPSGIE